MADEMGYAYKDFLKKGVKKPMKFRSPDYTKQELQEKAKQNKAQGTKEEDTIENISEFKKYRSLQINRAQTVLSG